MRKTTAPEGETADELEDDIPVGAGLITEDRADEHVDHGGFGLPPGVDPADMMPDPSRRPNHWLHKPTGDVFACPAGWKPKK